MKEKRQCKIEALNKENKEDTNIRRYGNRLSIQVNDRNGMNRKENIQLHIHSYFSYFFLENNEVDNNEVVNLQWF